MRTSEYTDKKIMDLSRSKNMDSFTFFTPDDDSDDDFADGHTFGFDLDRSLGASHSRPPTLTNRNSTDHIDSGKFSQKEVRLALASEIHQTMKEHFDNLLRSVDGLSARLSQIESKINQLENAVDNLKISTEYNNGRTDGKLRQLENILREVQDGVLFLKDKQEITETLLQLAKLQGSKSDPQPEDPKTAGQSKSAPKAPSPASEQSPQPPLVSGAFSPALPTLIPDTSSTLHYQNATPGGAPVAAPVHSQTLQNPIPSCPPPEPYYFPAGKALEATYQQYNVSPTQESRPPPPAPPHFYKPALNLPQVMGESTQRPQFRPPLHEVNPQNQHSWTHHPPEELPPYGPYPPHNYRPNIHQSSSLPADGPPIHHQFYLDSSQQLHGQPVKGPNSEFPSGYSQTPEHANFGNMNPYGGSSSHYRSSTMKPWEITPSSSAQGGGSNYYTQLPKAQILPHALPTASIVDTGSSSGWTGNKAPIDDVVDRVTAMGFRRDLVRATVRKLVLAGMSVDLNVVLDKLMNDGNV
ncbi:hypothetical protein RHMOL_Rhmol08G0241700 [Rhododendron molle]|uniref:Uncharacterized protein n=1 Tax=Rhododendron molle TaxID=49168 RepID=A0ACC0MRZ1_RHOML|nr:hypothetical protein RHMOL_Rhmol08G0241700 [Rhododendron molle]